MGRKTGLISISSLFLLIICALIFINVSSCGGGSSCGGTTFVNQSSEAVTVSASATSGIQFSTFTLQPGEEKKICGDDTNGIGGDYAWPDGDTAQLGLTWSGGDFCIYLLSDHSADSGNC